MALVNTLDAFLLPWMDLLNFMMQLPDFLDTKNVIPLLSSVRPIWKKLFEKSKVLRTGFPAKCMNKLSMWPKVATSGLATEFVGLRSKHSLYLEEIGVGMDFFIKNLI